MVPGLTVIPALASTQFMTQFALILLAKGVMNFPGICCTKNIGAGRLAGSRGRTSKSVLGPPVEIPRATALNPGPFFFFYYPCFSVQMFDCLC